MRPWRHILFFLFCAAAFTRSAAQSQCTITIQVSDAGGSLPGVVISAGSLTTVATNADGQATIILPEGMYELSSRMAGYHTETRKVNLQNGETVTLRVVLQPDINPLDEIVISTERYEQKLGEVTVSTDVIRPALIQNKNITSIDQLMAQVPGVTMADGQASIRGGSGFTYGAGSRVLMLVDEMPMISADAGDIKWNFLPVENLEQVEVVKGASSVLYGSGALNGVVNLRTAFAREKPLTTASMYYGGYDAPRKVYKWWQGSGQRQQGINVSHARKIGRFDLVIGAHKFDDDGFRMLETESRERVNANLRYNFRKVPGLTAGINTNAMNTRGGLFFLWQHYDSAYIPRGRSIQNYDNKRFNIDPYISYLRGNDSSGSKLSLRTRYFKTHNSNDKNQGSYAELFYSELQYSRWWNTLRLTTGLVEMEQVILGDSIYGLHRGRNLAGYFQASKKLLKRLTIVAGVRGEYYRLDTAETRATFLGKRHAGVPVQPVLRIGLNYQAAPYTYFRASTGQGYRFPSVAEKFVNTSVSALKILPNPGLQPERSFSSELSVKQGLQLGGFRGFADLSFFYTRYFDMIEFVFDIYNPAGKTGIWFLDAPWAGFKSQNIGSATVSGAELGLSGSGLAGPVKATVFAGYTYIDPVFGDFDPARDTLGLPGVKTLKYRSRHLAKADVQLEYRRFSLGYSARYQSRIENIDRRFVISLFEEYNNPPFLNFNLTDMYDVLPGLRENYSAFSKPALVQDLRAGFQLTRFLRLSFIVNNFMNVEYQNRPGDVRAPTLYTGQLLLRI